MKNREKKRKVKIWIVLVSVSVLLVSLKVLDYYGSSDSKPEYPDYEMVELSETIHAQNIYNGTLSNEEKNLIFMQTGIGEQGMEEIRNSAKNAEECMESLKEYQVQLFRGTGHKKLVDLQNGDILVSVSQRFCFYPHGHAAIVVDASQDLLLEARSYDAGSCICEIEKWDKMSSIVVLRLKKEVVEKFEEEEGINPAESTAAYAKENLVGLKYSLFKDIRPLAGTNLEYTQCAHLVWYAYYVCGLDIDENRGIIIKPKDFLQSDILEVVQVFGISPEKIIALRNE